MNKIERALVNKDNFTVGDRIRLARMGVGLTVNMAAVRMNIMPVSLYEKENGSSQVRSLSKFEDAIGIKRGTLLQDTCSLSHTDTPKPPLLIPEHRRHSGKRGSKAEKNIEATIRQRISDGTYKGKLPSTLELAKEFGYSRQTVNLALQPLRQEGIIYGKKKAGIFITESRT